jgi:hypothetical protein
MKHNFLMPPQDCIYLFSLYAVNSDMIPMFLCIVIIISIITFDKQLGLPILLYYVCLNHFSVYYFYICMKWNHFK